MKKIYFASRIKSNDNPESILSVNKDINTAELVNLYKKSCVSNENYIYNGHFILRPVDKLDRLLPNNLPKGLNQSHILDAVRFKIDESDIFFARVNSKSFGVIVELGYAAGIGKPVYVLPENDLTKEELEDLWLVFQFSLLTRSTWSETDFTDLPYFKDFGIRNSDEYINFINNIVPPFLK